MASFERSISGRSVSDTTDEGFVLRPGQGRAIDLGGSRMTVKAAGEQTAGAFTLLEADEPPGFGPPLHTHLDCAEAFYVLDGEYVIFLGDREERCPAGSFIYIPRLTPHGFRVGATPSRKLNFYIPAAMLGYFDDLSVAIQRGEADPDVLGDIARTYAVEIIGPVPEGYL